MSSKNWTDEQLQAINSLGGTVLVSAAAGSGKTSVLIERVIKRISCAENPTDIDKLLIVTFTNAAAEEMKLRLSNVLAKEIEKHPENVWFKRQELLLQKANISTIDSFCTKLLRENFQNLHISADFRILDENELILLKNKVLDQVFNRLYQEKDPRFIQVLELFNYGRDDKVLMEVIDKIYKYILSYPFPEQWLDSKIKYYEDPNKLNETVWGKLSFLRAKEIADYCESIITTSLSILENDDILKLAYKPSFEHYEILLNNIKEAIDSQNWDQMYYMLRDMEPRSFKAVRNCENLDIKEKLKLNRNEIKKNLEELKDIFSSSEKQCLEDIREMGVVISTLKDIIRDFTEKLTELKREKNALDFSDLLHLSLKLLIDFDEVKGEYVFTNYAKELREKFVEIIIDEYQDINDAQELLFQSISHCGKNIFMVGDSKQSIYRFRQASPKIFLEKRSKFNDINDKMIYPLKVYLSKNFRSEENIINAVNFFFSQLMSKDLGDIEYDKSERLVFSAKDRKYSAVELNIINSERSEDTEDILEARLIARKIKEKVSNTGKESLKYRDFCILLRSLKGHAEVIERELNRLGIPTICEGKSTFLNTVEISTLVSLLKIIDNPLQDIPLASIMLSPIYSFTVDDLASIRLKYPDQLLYFAVKNLAEEENQLAKKCKDFLKQIRFFRSIATNMALNRFINKVLDETNYLIIASNMKNGEVRVANLRIFVKYSHNYEKASFKGLHSFVNFINNLQKQKVDLQPAVQQEDNNAVRILSIHKAKGLEFPVCILANLSRRFHLRQEEISINSDLGIATYLRDKVDADIKYANLTKQIIQQKEKLESLSEELRILYVAMTRAKESLILICSEKKIAAKLKSLAEKIRFHQSHAINSQVLKNCNSFSDWILICSLLHRDAYELRKIAEFDGGIDVSQEGKIDFAIVLAEDLRENKIKVMPEKSYISRFKDSIKVDDSLILKIEKQLGFRYAYEADTKLPSKISASEFSGENIDIGLNEKPSFIYGGKTFSGAAKGSAMHKFMEYANYDEAQKNIYAHLDYLVKCGTMSKQEVSIINVKQLQDFLCSNLCRRICESEKFFREFKFSFLLDPKKFPYLNFNRVSEEVVLQGAVDCIFVEKSGLSIVDYKSDVLSEKVLKQRYFTQLSLYKEAISDIFGCPINECILYSFSLNKSIVL